MNALSSPSVCVIDDEPEDYSHILAALNALHISAVHFRGETLDGLPQKPFKELRLVLTDLHLSATSGKTAASHTANVFRRIVSEESGPVVVVIWSKYAGDKAQVEGVPIDDQETEAELFKRTLLEAVPLYRGRLVFLEMAKPKKTDRPEDWTIELQAQLKERLSGHSAIDVVWRWERLVREACGSVVSSLTSLAVNGSIEAHGSDASLMEAMRLLARAQGGGELSPESAPRHLVAALAQLLADNLEHQPELDQWGSHGTWLCAVSEADNGAVKYRSALNGLLLTTAPPAKNSVYGPGVVYRVVDRAKCLESYGIDVDRLIAAAMEDPESKKKHDWETQVCPILIDLSPACDVAQNKRHSAFLVAGLVVPVDLKKLAKKRDAWRVTEAFELRWPSGDFAASQAFLAFNSLVKATPAADAVAGFLAPWFRLRELPTAALRNWNAAQASRVGYVSL